MGPAAGKQRDWLVILHARPAGGASLIGVVEALGGAAATAAADTRSLIRLGLSAATAHAISKPDDAPIEKTLQWLEHPAHHLVCWDDEAYPALLRRIDNPPAALFVDGDPGCLWQPQIAIVGSRNPTAGGRDHALDFAATLSRQGMTITSGMASGIDAAAHTAALDAGGNTIAVTGTGLDIVYPASSRKLAARIPAQGAVVTEFPLGTAPKRHHFPQRNRIISGLSLAVLVVEAGLNSGTLITARNAAEQGREVFALPGSLHNPMAKGCHRLIREGARLVENTAHIMQELGPLATELQSEISQQLESAPVETTAPGGSEDLLDDADYRAVWDVLGYDPKPIDEIIEHSGRSAAEVSSMLLMLELRGLVANQGHGRYHRA